MRGGIGDLMELNLLKTVERAVNFRRTAHHSPLPILNSPVSTVDPFPFLCSNLSWDLRFSSHIDTAEDVLPQTTQEAEPASGTAANTLLLREFNLFCARPSLSDRALPKLDKSRVQQHRKAWGRLYTLSRIYTNSGSERETLTYLKGSLAPRTQTFKTPFLRLGRQSTVRQNKTQKQVFPSSCQNIENQVPPPKKKKTNLYKT